MINTWLIPIKRPPGPRPEPRGRGRGEKGNKSWKKRLSTFFSLFLARTPLQKGISCAPPPPLGEPFSFFSIYCASFWDGVVGSLFQFSLNSVCWSTFQGRSGKVALPKKRSGEKRVFLVDGVVGSFFQFSLNSVCRFTFQKRSGKVARPDRFWLLRHKEQEPWQYHKFAVDVNMQAISNKLRATKRGGRR